jgi:hypothetical protein
MGGARLAGLERMMLDRSNRAAAIFNADTTQSMLYAPASGELLLYAVGAAGHPAEPVLRRYARLAESNGSGAASPAMGLLGVALLALLAALATAAWLRRDGLMRSAGLRGTPRHGPGAEADSDTGAAAGATLGTRAAARADGDHRPEASRAPRRDDPSASLRSIRGQGRKNLNVRIWRAAARTPLRRPPMSLRLDRTRNTP